MTFSSKAGTRGARQPSANRLVRWVNSRTVNRIRRKRGTFMGMNVLALTTVGRRSGAERTNPVAWFPGPDGSRLIVASAAGAPGNPAWYHNIAANPGKVRIEVDGSTVAVTAEQLHGTEREAAWQQITAAAPRFAQYQVKTDRELPVIRLVAHSGPGEVR